jgi:hypothetical protein
VITAVMSHTSQLEKETTSMMEKITTVSMSNYLTHSNLKILMKELVKRTS